MMKRDFKEGVKVQVFLDGLGERVAIFRGGRLWLGKTDLGTPDELETMPGMNWVMNDPDPMTGEPQFMVELTEYEIQLLARALLRDDEVMDEAKATSLAKLRNVLEVSNATDES